MLELFNIIILLLIIHVVLYNRLGRKNPGLLACGIFCFIGNKDNHNFNWDKFNLLGLDNDERGGDSVGRAVGNDIRKFVDNKKAQTTYKNYVINHKNGDPHHIALGHTRKASIGAISEETAQPVVIDIPGGGKFIMVHNGTIYNWEDLAKKYGISTFGKSDSMVLGEIIYNYGYDVLLEYNGAAAIAIRDDREPDTVKVFKGMSKSFNKVEEERPLYYYNESDTDMYISSREEGLYFIGADGDEVNSFDSNVLFTIKDGQVIYSADYNRSQCSQNRVWANQSNTFANNTTRMYATRYYNDDSFKEGCRLPLPATTQSKKQYNIREENIIKSSLVNRITTARLRYYFFDKNSVHYYVNGPVWLTELGDRVSDSNRIGCKEYFFYCGVMLKDEESYKKVKMRFGRARQFVDDDKNISILSQFACHPICTVDNTFPEYANVRTWVSQWDADLKKHMYRACLYTGNFQMLFGAKVYEFNCGIQIDLKWADLPRKAVHEFKTATRSLVDSNGKKLSSDEEYAIWVDSYCSDIDEIEDYPTPKEVVDAKTIDEIFYETADEDDDVTEQSDAEFESNQLNEYALTSLKEGLMSILTSIDNVIMTVESTGLNGPVIAKVLSNLYASQDIFIDDKIRNNNLIASYEEF